MFCVISNQVYIIPLIRVILALPLYSYRHLNYPMGLIKKLKNKLIEAINTRCSLNTTTNQ